MKLPSWKWLFWVTWCAFWVVGLCGAYYEHRYREADRALELLKRACCMCSASTTGEPLNSRAARRENGEP